MMASDATINLTYLFSRLSLIVIGITAAFLVNALIFPPNHQKNIFHLIKKAFDKTSFLLRVIPNQTMKVKEVKELEENLRKTVKDVKDYLEVIIDEKSRMFIRNRHRFMRDIVIFKQMIKVIELEYRLIQNLEAKLTKVAEISENQSFLVKKLLAKIVEYRENIMLTYEDKIEIETELQRESFTAMNLTINDLINELQQSEIDQWIEIFPVASSIVTLMVELEKLDTYIKRHKKVF